MAVETAIPAGYDSRVFVGVTEAARKQGIDADKLEIEEYVLRTVGNDLYIVGKELHPEQYHGSRPRYSEPWNPLATECVHSGTLLGVYEVLENYLGVRWLWPGDLGTYVPRRSTIVIPEIDKTVKPRLLYRNLGGWDLPQIFLTGSYFGRKVPRNYRVGGLSEELVSKLVFPTEEAGYTYGKAVEVYHRRHRRVTQIEDPRVRPGLACDRGRHRLVGASTAKNIPNGLPCAPTGNADSKCPEPALDSAVRLQSRTASLHCGRGLGRRRRVDIGRSRRRRRKHVSLSAMPGLGRSAATRFPGGFAPPEIHAAGHGRSLRPLLESGL